MPLLRNLLRSSVFELEKKCAVSYTPEAGRTQSQPRQRSRHHHDFGVLGKGVALFFL